MEVRLLNLAVIFVLLLTLVLTTGCKRQVIVREVRVPVPCPKAERPVRRAWETHEGGDCPTKYVCMTQESADALSDEIESLRDFVRGR